MAMKIGISRVFYAFLAIFLCIFTPYVLATTATHTPIAQTVARMPVPFSDPLAGELTPNNKMSTHLISALPPGIQQALLQVQFDDVKFPFAITVKDGLTQRVLINETNVIGHASIAIPIPHSRSILITLAKRQNQLWHRSAHYTASLLINPEHIQPRR